MQSSLFCFVKQGVVLNPYRPLKFGHIGRPETSVKLYLYTLYNNPEERMSHLQNIATGA